MEQPGWSEELAAELTKLFPPGEAKNGGFSSGPDPREWTWRNTELTELTRPIFTASEMLKAGKQAVNPPTDNEEILAWWESRPFKVGGDVLFESSMIPPEVKAKLLEGLESKKLTWEYLLSSQFLEMAKHAAVQVSDILLVIDIVMSEDVKSDAGLMLEELTELFWRTRSTIGGIAFNQTVVDVMKKSKVTLSTMMLEGNRHGSTLRAITHPEGCDCWFCSYEKCDAEEAYTKYTWETYRLQMQRKGIFVMSYKQFMEIENNKVSDAVWDSCAATKEILNDPRYVGKTRDPFPKRRLSKNASLEAKVARAAGMTPLSAFIIFNDPRVHYGDGTEPFTNVTADAVKKACAIFDLAHKEKRIPTHCEIDELYRLMRGPDWVPPTKPPAVADAAAPVKAPGGGSAGAATSRASSRAASKVDYMESSDGSGSSGSAFSDEDDEDEEEDDDSFSDSDDDGESVDDDDDGNAGAKAPKKSASRKSSSGGKAAGGGGGKAKPVTFTPEIVEALLKAAVKEAKERVRLGKGPNRNYQTIIDDVKAAIGVELTKKQVSHKLDALKSKGVATVTGPLSNAEEDTLLKAAKEADEKLAGRKRPPGFWVAIRDEHFFGRDVKDLRTAYNHLQESLKRTGNLPIRESEVPTILDVYTRFRGGKGWAAEAARRLVGRGAGEVSTWYRHHRDRFPSFEEAEEKEA